MEKENRKIYLLMVICTVFWAGAFIAGKIGVREFPPFSLAFFRFLFATIIIFAVMFKYEKKDWRLKHKDWLYMFLLGFIGMFGYHALFFTALKYTTAMNSSMIGATNPLITSILAAVFLKEHLGVKRFGAILLAFTGIILTVSNGDMTLLKTFSFNVGDLFMLAAVFCWAVYSIISRKIMDRYSPLILTSYSFLVCLVLLIPFVIWEKPAEYLPKATWAGWASVLYMAIFASVIGYLVQQVSIKTIGASKTAAFINLVPVFSIILSAIILHEKITGVKLLSAVIIITGVYFNTKLKSLTEASVIKNKTMG